LHKHFLIQEVEKAYGILNSYLFSKKLLTPEIILCPKKKLIVRWKPENQTIVIGGDLVKVDINAFLLHLLHEMVHIFNYSKGLIDCRSNQYHNKFFLTAALDVGLIVIYNKTQGWGITVTNAGSGHDVVHPTEEAVQRRISTFEKIHFSKSIFNKVKQEITRSNRRTRQTTFFLKYECSCPQPHNSIRSGRRPDGDYPLNIRCLDCGKEFLCVEE
jgi:hypothetical protein